MDITHEEYICEDCGNTTTVPNDTCPSCGGILTPLGSQEAHSEENSEEDENLSDTMITDEGHTSLDALRAQEEQDDSPNYSNEE